MFLYVQYKSTADGFVDYVKTTEVMYLRRWEVIMNQE
jgi:hypothetical protein